MFEYSKIGGRRREGEEQEQVGEKLEFEHEKER